MSLHVLMVNEVSRRFWEEGRLGFTPFGDILGISCNSKISVCGLGALRCVVCATPSQNFLEPS